MQLDSKKISAFLYAAILSWPFEAHAIPIQYRIEPIVGLERVQKLLPDAHTSTRLFYGARATAGVPFASLEGEYTRSQDEESFPLQSTSTLSTGDKAKVGIRGSYSLGQYLNLNARIGGEASQEKTEVTSGGSSTSETTPIQLRPYLGAGVQLNFTKKLSFSAEVVATFRELPDFSQNNYQASAGLAVSLP